jgi:hypothetical protein
LTIPIAGRIPRSARSGWAVVLGGVTAILPGS